MMTLRIGSLQRRCVSGAMIFIAPLVMAACAELEVGAEVAKRVNGAVSGSKVAQATEPAAIDVVETTSPLLEPAPQLFEATGVAVWDGKRTLQGIWVAHPLAASARRVRIFNEGTELAVDGALFRREASLEGSSVLISSEAARLLGMEVDQPADLRIVAVKPASRPAAETVPAPETETAAAGETPGPSETGQAESASDTVDTTDTVETTEIAAATPAPETSATEAPATETSTSVASTTEAPVTPAPTTTQPVSEGTATAPPRAQPEVSQTGAVATANTPTRTGPIRTAEPSGTALPVPATSAAPQPATPELPKPEPTVVAEVPTQPAPRPEPAVEQPGPVVEKPELVVEQPEPADPPKVDVPVADKIEVAQSSSLAKPFIQAGIFGVAGNAQKLLTRLKSAGLPAQGKTFKSNGKTLTRVIAGPFQNEPDRDKAQREIRQMGLGDAVPVKR